MSDMKFPWSPWKVLCPVSPDRGRISNDSLFLTLRLGLKLVLHKAK